MLPIIIESDLPEAVDEFITHYIDKHQISSFSVLKYQPEKKELGIDTIRALKMQTVTQVSQRRLIILFSFETASVEAQNALLKTLEEKTASNQFLLITNNAERVLPTIRSRSRHIFLKNTHETIEKGYDAFFTSIIEKNTFAYLGDALIQGITREKAIELVDASIVFLRNQYLSLSSVTEIMKRALVVKQLLQNNNTNPQLSVDNYLIFFKKQSAKNAS